jgi:hypothetical protein
VPLARLRSSVFVSVYIVGTGGPIVTGAAVAWPVEVMPPVVLTVYNAVDVLLKLPRAVWKTPAGELPKLPVDELSRVPGTVVLVGEVNEVSVSVIVRPKLVPATVPVRARPFKTKEPSRGAPGLLLEPLSDVNWYAEPLVDRKLLRALTPVSSRLYEVAVAAARASKLALGPPLTVTVIEIVAACA